MKYIKKLLFTILTYSSFIFPQKSMLDSTFANDGKVITDLGSFKDIGFSTAIQPDGKIVVAGQYFSNNYEFAVARYKSDGTLDTDFGADGKVVTAVGPHFDHGRNVALQTDGKIVVVGYSWNGTNEDFSVVRYNSDGTLDNTFSDNGKVISDFGSSKDNGYDLAIQSDGKIVVAGYSDSGGDENFALIRYNSDGTLDNTFSNDGKVITDFNSSKDRGESIVIQSDGKIIVAGYSNNGGDRDFAIVRFNTDGILDNSFGSNGQVTTDLGTSYDEGYDVSIQTDGKIVILGSSSDALALVRYNTDGTLDAGFGTDGIISTSAFLSLYDARSIAIQDDGKIIVAGYRSNSITHNKEIAITRYNDNGTLDTGFNSDGIATAGFDSSHAVGQSVVIQDDGKIVVAGYSLTGSNNDFALVRFNKEAPIIDPPPTTPVPFDSLVYFKFDRSGTLKKHKITSDDYINNELDEIWNNTSKLWTKYSQTIFSFDVNDNRIEDLGEFWDNNEWGNWWRSNYTFDEDGNKKTWQYYTWISFWSAGVTETYSYDSNGNIILKEAIVDFENAWRDSLIYDLNGKLITYLTEDWVNDQWVNDSRETYIYNTNGKLSEKLKEDWEDNQWIKDRKETYSYDSNNNLIMMQLEKWNAPGQFDIQEKATYTYNSNQNITHAKREKLIGTDWQLTNGELEYDNISFKKGIRFTATELFIHYDGLTVVQDIKSIPNDYIINQNYPNPFNPSTTIRYSIPNESEVSLSIYNILGAKVHELFRGRNSAGNYEVNWNASNFSSGVYFLRMSAVSIESNSHFTDVKKLILLK